MYTVFAERYRDDRNTTPHALEFETLDAAFSWMRDNANPTSGSFVVPCDHTREVFADPRHIHLGWLPVGSEWLVHEIDSDAGILFSDGSRTCGKAHISKTVQDRLERLWDECKNPESRFAEEGSETPDDAVRTPRDPDRCPRCGSSSIEGDSPDFDRTRVYQRVACLECGFRWSDAYVYESYVPLRNG